MGIEWRNLRKDKVLEINRLTVILNLLKRWITNFKNWQNLCWNKMFTGSRKKKEKQTNINWIITISNWNNQILLNVSNGKIKWNGNEIFDRLLINKKN